jgi:8-oxo-dGTP diphosphatase
MEDRKIGTTHPSTLPIYQGIIALRTFIHSILLIIDKTKDMSIFNIRVYALFTNEKNEVLVTDEFRFGMEMTKFPGGGLIWGEGIIDCLKRECREELGCEIEVLRHFYTTDFFQPAAFYKDHQLISIYYLVRNTSPLSVTISTKKNDFERIENAQSFRWVHISKLNTDEFTFPIDRKVVEMLSLKS